MTWNFPRNEALHAELRRMSAYKKSALSVSASVDRRRAMGIEPCKMGLNKNANNNLLGKRK